MKKMLSLLFVCLSLSLFAEPRKYDTTWTNSLHTPTLSVQEHYDLGYQLLKDKEWEESLKNFLIVVHHFKESPFFADSMYYSGVCYYFLAHFDIANTFFSRYLTIPGTLKHFERVFDFKFHIAEYFREGRRRHAFGKATMPRVASGKNLAIEIYDEVIASLPAKEIAVKALFSKGLLLKGQRNYTESVDVFQALIRRFPKHELSAESYLEIGDIYLERAKKEGQNVDLIAFAEINATKFQKTFPSDDRSEVLKNRVTHMQEVYARGLYDTGRFYERKKKPLASAIYYRDTLSKFPETEAARKCQERLKIIDKT